MRDFVILDLHVCAVVCCRFAKQIGVLHYPLFTVGGQLLSVQGVRLYLDCLMAVQQRGQSQQGHVFHLSKYIYRI